LQQLELAQIQYRDANLTALAAIGPRKKRPLESGNEKYGRLDPDISWELPNFCSEWANKKSYLISKLST
ncbi:hypothetical protein A6R68_15774, partial [Neotoma lepida]